MPEIQHADLTGANLHEPKAHTHGLVDTSASADQISTTATNGAITVLHTRTLTDLAAGTYALDAVVYQHTTNGWGGTIRLRAAGQTVVDIGGHAPAPAWKPLFGQYVHAGGDLTVEIVFVSESVSLQFGNAGDWRFGRRLRIMKVV